YGVLLSRYAGQEDIVVGSPVAGRRHPDAERMIRDVRGHAGDAQPRAAKAKRSRRVLGGSEGGGAAMENQDYPFEELVEKVEVRRDTSRENIYGPTEATIYATQEAVTRQTEKVGIGKPLPNVRTYVVDRSNKPQPIGVPGELCI
ncbi:AMP-binding protein, partial [Paenibacillus rhizoplanae]